MSVPLFDETARDGRQGELASLIRRATRIQPFGPNSRAVHDSGGAVHLTPAEAEEAARAVLESDWLRDRLTAEREAGAAEVRARVETAAAQLEAQGFQYGALVVRAALSGGGSDV